MSPPGPRSTKDVKNIECGTCPESIYKDKHQRNLFYCSAGCARTQYPELPMSPSEIRIRTNDEIAKRMEQQQREIIELQQKHKVEIELRLSNENKIRDQYNSLKQQAVAVYSALNTFSLDNDGVKQFVDDHRGLVRSLIHPEG